MAKVIESEETSDLTPREIILEAEWFEAIYKMSKLTEEIISYKAVHSEGAIFLRVKKLLDLNTQMRDLALANWKSFYEVLYGEPSQ